MSEYDKIEWNCVGAPSQLKLINGDGNCYFRAKVMQSVRETMCNYIEYFDYDVAPFLKKDKGMEYLKRSKMRELALWTTETEIMATAKIF